MNLFRGYIKTSGKKPLEKVIGNNELYTLEQISFMDSDYGGVLNDDVVMVDVDDSESADKVRDILKSEGIKCESLKTGRGRHFYMLNDGSIKTNKIGTLTLCGIRVDIKLGSKHTVVPLRIDFGVREFEPSPEYIDVIPTFLRPSRYAKDLSGSCSRNQDLFNYILALQNDHYSKEEIRGVLEIINKYIFKEPLPKSELETILREEAFTKPTFYVVDEKGRSKFQHNVFATWMMNELSLIKMNGNLHMYQDGEYKIARDLNSYIIEEIDTLRKSERMEVMNYIHDKIRDEKQQADMRYVNCANGVYNMKTGELTPHSKDIIITNKIPTGYNGKSECKEVDEMMDRIACGDKEIVNLIYEMIGYTLYRRNELAKYFILVGDGSNGKSTLLQMITNMIGDKNCSAISLKDTQDRFKSSQVVGMLANIGDDIGDEYIDQNDNFKKMISGNPVTFENKGKDPFISSVYTKFIFSCNTIPRCKDTSFGFERRLTVVPLNANFSNSDEYDPYIIDKLTTKEAAEYLLKKSIEGLHRVIQNKGFTKTEKVEQALEDYKIQNNSVLGFIADGGKFENELVNESYAKYSRWCEQNGCHALSKIKVGKILSTKYGLESRVNKFDGQSIRVYLHKM